MVTVIQKTTDSKEAVRRKWRLRDVLRIPAGDQHGPLGMGGDPLLSTLRGSSLVFRE